MKFGKKKFPILSSDLVDYLKSEAEGPFSNDIFSELEKRTKQNDKNAWSAIYQIMRDADSGKIIWALHNKLLSGIFYILSQVGDSQAYRIVINYIKSLDRGIPIGAIELVSGLLPAFKDINIEELLELAQSTDDYKSSFGIVALSKLAIENRLSEHDKECLEKILRNYKNHKHYLEDYVESTLAHLEDMKTGTAIFEMSDLDALVAN